MADDVALLAGGDAMNCGFTTTESSANQLRSVSLCARKAALGNGPFRFGYRSFGTDSSYCSVAVRSQDGQLWSVYVDVDLWRMDGGGATLWVSRCEEVDFAQRTIGPGSFFKLTDCQEAPDVQEKFIRRGLGGSSESEPACATPEPSE